MLINFTNIMEEKEDNNNNNDNIMSKQPKEKISKKCINRRKRKLEQLSPEQLRCYELSAELQSCVKVCFSFVFVGIPLR